MIRATRGAPGRPGVLSNTERKIPFCGILGIKLQNQRKIHWLVSDPTGSNPTLVTACG